MLEWWRMPSPNLTKPSKPVSSSAMPPAVPERHVRTSTSAVILAILILNTLGIVLLFFKLDWDVRQISAEIGLVRDVVKAEKLARERTAMEEEDDAMMEQVGLREITLRNHPGYPSWWGVAELRGYYTTVRMAATLDSESDEYVECDAFVVMDGPEGAMSEVSDGRIILGALGSNTGFDDAILRSSTEASPVTGVFSIGSEFEGEVVGCMSPMFRYSGLSEDQ